MPGWLKALLITAIVVVLLVAGLVGAGVLWWMRNKESLRAHAKEAAAEGREFGQSSDNQACVDETFSRYKKEPGFFNSLNYSRFMEVCLEVSRPTSGFCDKVPVGKMMELAEWRNSQCRRYDLPNDQKCAQILMAEIMFCGSKKRGEQNKE
jgi:hypothetical protein